MPLNIDFVTPFVKSTVDFMTTMAQVEVKAGKPFAKTDITAMGEVTGIISMVGEKHTASLAISFTKSAIVAITNNMLGGTIKELEMDVIDTVGEVTNIVTGGAKKLLVLKGYKFGISLPSVILGKGHSVVHTTKAPVVVIPFSTDNGDFFIEICSMSLKKEKVN
ncbi:MAG: chemotaxis protein CheX [Candidatus Magnetominusculus sp. LBB02]|nr:chemotaxis protein CheX [Candidatus Magnetominusculus sp. LBB02]